MKEYEYLFVKHENLSKLLKFYQNNVDDMVRPRPEKIIIDAVDNGAFYDLEDFNEEIKGAAGAYEYLQHKYIEIGSTKILEEIQGYGLHKLFITSRILNTIYFMPPEESIFCSIKKNNSKSINSVRKLGFEEWEPPEDLITARSEILNVSSNENIQFMRFLQNQENLSIIAKEYLRCMNQSKFQNRDIQKPLIRVNIRLGYLSSQEAIQEIASYILE